MPASKFLTASFGLSALALAVVAAPPAASAAPAATGLSSLGAANPQLVQQVRWRGHRHWHGRRWHRHGYRGGAVAAGVLGGLALGAAIGAAAAAPPPPPVYVPAYGARADWIAYCSSKYRSFDPATGTYLGYDGFRHPCQ